MRVPTLKSCPTTVNDEQANVVSPGVSIKVPIVTRCMEERVNRASNCFYHACRAADLHSLPKRIHFSGMCVCRLGKCPTTISGPWAPRNVWSGVSGSGNPNMKLVLVLHTGTESYHLPSPKHRNLLTLRSGSGTRNGVQIRTPRKVWDR